MLNVTYNMTEPDYNTECLIKHLQSIKLNFKELEYYNQNYKPGNNYNHFNNQQVSAFNNELRNSDYEQFFNEYRKK